MARLVDICTIYVDSKAFEEANITCNTIRSSSPLHSLYTYIYFSSPKSRFITQLGKQKREFEPVHKKRVLITRANSDGPGEPAHLHSLARA